MSCCHLKRALQVRRAQVKRTVTRSCLHVALKYRAVARRNTRLFARLGDAKEELAKMRSRNAAIEAEALEVQIAQLPPRQQEAVRQRFAASKVKHNVLHYTKSWVLDCLIKRMKSPQANQPSSTMHMHTALCLALVKKY